MENEEEEEMKKRKKKKGEKKRHFPHTISMAHVLVVYSGIVIQVWNFPIKTVTRVSPIGKKKKREGLSLVFTRGELIH